MTLGVVLLVLGGLLALAGHRTGRLQVRAVGAAIAAFGLVTALLALAFG